MNIQRLTKEEARVALEEWKVRKSILPLTQDYSKIRNKILEILKSIDLQTKKNDYKFDIKLGSQLYSFFENEFWFNVRLASDDGFWRYLSVVVVPDIVHFRWKENMDDHCWKKAERIWLKCIWWYIHISLYRNDVEETLKLLEKPVFNTDIIMNIVERTGQKGFYLEVTRKLMFYYGQLTPTKLSKYAQERKYSSDTLFRAIMRLNTVRLPVIDPMLVEGGSDGYVRSLFMDFNIKFD